MILDTDALSAMADGDPDLEPVLRLAGTVALPVIALGEYRYGVRQSRNRAKYEGWLVALMESCRVLDVDGIRPNTTPKSAPILEKAASRFRATTSG